MTSERLACIMVPDFAYQVVSKTGGGFNERPTVVAESEWDCSALASLNDAARAVSLSIGMTVAQARHHCPDLKVFFRNSEAEEEVSGQFLKRLQTIGPFIETSQPGLYYLQASGLERLYGSENGLADQIGKKLQTQKLPLKTGLASNKLIARIAAGLSGINHRLIVPSGGEQKFLAPLKVEHLFLPIGGELKSETVSKLHDLGIHTVGHLATFPPHEITHRFGQELLALSKYARGEDPERLKPSQLVSQLTHRLNLDYPLRTIPQLMTHLAPMLEELLGLLSASSRGCQTINWQFISPRQKRVALEVSLATPTASRQLFLRQTERLLEGSLLRNSSVKLADLTEVRIAIPTAVPLIAQQIMLPASKTTLAPLATLAPGLQECHLCQVQEEVHLLPERKFSLVPLKLSSKTRKVALKKDRSELAYKTNLTRQPFASGFLGGLRLVSPPEKVAVTNEKQKLVWLDYQNRQQKIISQRGPWKLSGHWQQAQPDLRLNTKETNRLPILEKQRATSSEGVTYPLSGFNRVYFEIEIEQQGQPLLLLIFVDRLSLHWFVQGIFD